MRRSPPENSGNRGDRLKGMYEICCKETSRILKSGKNEIMEAIKFEKVNFSYGGEEKDSFALRDVSFAVEEGEFVAVLGHNGSGKSTLARLVDGLLSPSDGKISVLGLDAAEGKNTFEIRKNVGIVFQNPDNQTVASIVEDDIAFGPENIGIPREEIGRRISFALDAVGMSEFRHSTPSRLSGGQKQRIAIAGVLALKPKIMILDESTAMLDPRGRKEVTDVVLKLNREEKITVLLITHFPEEAMLADRAIVMNRGEIVMQGKPAEILCREDELETFNLTLPRPVQICRDLRKRGLPIEDVLTPEALGEELFGALEERRKRVSPSEVPLSENGEAGLSAEDASFSKTAETDVLSTEAEEREGKSDDSVGRIDCRNLSYIYNAGSPFASQALNGVDLTIGSGEFFGIIGHTGSGKSTFVQHLNALIKLPTAEKKYKPKKLKKGEVPPPLVKLTVDGYDLTDKKTDFRELRSKVGMVFQYPEYQLFAETVFADVAFGLKNFSKEEPKEEEVKQAVRDALETVGLDYEEIKNRSPFELSGGQKRRVAIAGVIVTKPEILVLDEPAAGLDPLGKREIMQLLHKIHKDWCKTIIIVSHDMDEISENCSRAAVFSDGKVIASARPSELFLSPDRLTALGLDVPFTAKVTEFLAGKGIKISSDFTCRDFVEKVCGYAGIAGGEAHA